MRNSKVSFCLEYIIGGIPLTGVDTRCSVSGYGGLLQNLLELERQFSTEEACRQYLCELRWPDGFRCPRCGHGKGWHSRDGLIRCTACDYKASVIAGTVFEGTRKPLVLWFRAIWLVTSQKNGASARGVQRVLGLGS